MTVVTVFRTTKIGMMITQSGLKVLETLRLVPAGTHSVGNALIQALEGLVAGGQQKLFTVSRVCLVERCHADVKRLQPMMLFGGLSMLDTATIVLAANALILTVARKPAA